MDKLMRYVVANCEDMEPASDGDWVRYEDAQRLIEELLNQLLEISEYDTQVEL